MKLELLALKWAVTEKFRSYLIGNEFTVYTDNNPLKYLETAKLGAVEQRWVSQLASFNLKVNYRPGRENTNADALSRKTDYSNTAISMEQVANTLSDQTSCTSLPKLVAEQLRVATHPPNLLADEDEGLPSTKERNVIGEVAKPNARETVKECEVHDPSPGITALPSYSKNGLIQMQHNDKNINEFLRYWEESRKPNSQERKELSSNTRTLLKQWEKISLKDGVLYRKSHDANKEEVQQLVLPSALRDKVLSSLHDDMGYQGLERTLHLIRTRFYWPAMYADTERWIKDCQRCTLSKMPQPKIRVPI